MPKRFPNGNGRPFAEVLNRVYEMPIEIDRAAEIDTEKRTVELSISSDQPIDHWFGRIILDHGKGSVRLDRVKSGAPLLLNHSVDQQIGVLETARLEGGKLRATARFSRSQLAEEIFRDIQDGIRRNTSAGFILHELDLEQKSDKGPSTYRSKDWEPLEASIAAVPRDISVGIGRTLRAEGDGEEDDPEADPKDNPTDEEETAERARRAAKSTTQVRSIMETTQTPPPATQPNPFVAMTERTNSFVTFAVGFGSTDERKAELTEMAREFALTNKTETEFFAALNEKRSAWATAPPPPAAPLVTLTDGERKRYSIARAILSDANARDRDYRGETKCFELEISEEIERKLDAPGAKKHGGFYMPTGIALSRGLELERAGLDTKTATKGQELVFTEPGSFIEMLRNKAKVMLLGATVLPGLTGNVAFPRQTGAGTFVWVGENPGADVADSNLLLDQVVLSPKTGQSSTSYSRQLLQQGVANVDGLVQNDLVQINALAIDLAAIHGGGAPAPTGLYSLTGVNAVAMGGAITFAKVVDMETVIEANNADVGTMAYLTTPEIGGKAKQAPVMANVIALPIFANGEMNGYRAEVSNQVSKTLGAGTNEHGIIFGVWSELLIGEWGALEIITDPYRLKKQGMIEVTSFVMVDVNARHAKACSKGTGLTNT